jgi:hypothetical protein
MLLVAGRSFILWNDASSSEPFAPGVSVSFGMGAKTLDNRATRSQF